MEIQKTPLYEDHVRLGAKLVGFAGWELPVEFEGLRAEHHLVRKGVGLFDVSHMGEIRVSGAKALESLQYLTTNDLSRIREGEAQYTLLTNEEGGVVDDLIIYCLAYGLEYLAVVNAANIQKDYHWMLANNLGARIVNESGDWAQIAVQGPMAPSLLSMLVKDMKPFEPFRFFESKVDDLNLFIASTGYTGELGYEILLAPERASDLWNRLLEMGIKFGARPIGLGARDTLRTEMKYSLYGHEIDDDTNPLEAGLGWAVKLNKGDFIGRGAIESAAESGVNRKLVGFRMLDKGIPRSDYELISFDKEKIGKVTSGTLSPTLNEGIGIGYLEKEFAMEGKDICVNIRGRPTKARVVKTPFVSTSLTAYYEEKKRVNRVE